MRKFFKPAFSFLLANDDVITYHDITKKISTPRYPPGNKLLSKWFNITAITAIALSPSISDLYSSITDRDSADRIKVPKGPVEKW